MYRNHGGATIFMANEMMASFDSNHFKTSFTERG
jgi:hypothetical protein